MSKRTFHARVSSGLPGRANRALLLLGGLLAGLSPAAGASGPVVWERRATALPESIWSVEAVDTDGDGRKELIAMGVTKVYAVGTDGTAPAVLFDAVDGKMLYCVALDADGDGDRDLAVGRYLVPWIDFRAGPKKGKAPARPQGPEFSVAWLENPGRKGGAPWRWHVVDRELNGIHGLVVGDVNRDGRPDLVADSISGPAFPNSVVWFDLAGGRTPVRRVVTRAGADGRPHYLDFADLAGDGRGVIVLGDSGGGTFTWWQPGRDPDAAWSKHLIGSAKGATNVRVADFNRDGRPDVAGACGHGVGIFWYEGPAWTRRVIDAELATPHALAVGDFDGDGDTDVAAASYTAFVVRWYENDGRGGFRPHDLDVGNRQQAYDLKAADLDGDGRTDLILAGRETRNAVVYFNRK